MCFALVIAKEPGYIPGAYFTDTKREECDKIANEINKKVFGLNTEETEEIVLICGKIFNLNSIYITKNRYQRF